MSDAADSKYRKAYPGRTERARPYREPRSEPAICAPKTIPEVPVDGHA